MTHSLVTKLKEIEAIPEYIKLDKDSEYLKQFDQHTNHPLLTKAIHEDFSFYDTTRTLAKACRVYLPKTQNIKHDQKLKELNLNPLFYAEALKSSAGPQKTLRYKLAAFIDDKITNPIGLGIVSSIFMSGLSLTVNELDKPTLN